MRTTVHHHAAGISANATGQNASPVRDGMFIEPCAFKAGQSRRGDMFVESCAAKAGQSRRDDMFVESCVPAETKSRRDDMFVATTWPKSGSPVRGVMFVERACEGLSSPVGAACPSRRVLPPAVMPPLRGWMFVLSGFYKHAIPTGLGLTVTLLFLALPLAARADALIVTNETPVFTLDTRLSAGIVPSSSTVVVESGRFTLDTRMPDGVVPSSVTVVAVSGPFILDTRMPAGISPGGSVVTAESPPFTLDTRLPDGTSFTNAVVIAESPPFALDTRLPADTTTFPNLVTQTESTPFTLDTRMVLQDPLYTNMIAMAESGPFTLDTLSGWFNTPAQTLAGGTTGGKARFSPDGLRLAKTDGSRVLLWNLHSIRSNVTFTGHAAEVATVEFSPLGDQLLTGSADGTLRWWDTASRAELGRTNPPGSGAVYAAYASDGARILAGRGANAALYRVPSMQLMQEFTGSEGSISAVAVCPEGLALAGNSFRSALLWDTATGAILHRLTNHTKLITAAAFFPGGTNAMTASLDGTIRIWDTATGVERLVLQQGSPVIDAALSLDGSLLVSCYEGNPLARGGGPEGTAHIWDVQSGALMRAFSDPSAPSQMKGVAISPDHTALATTYADGSVRLWNTGLEPRPIYPGTPLGIGTNAPVTLRSHGLYYFELNAEAGRSLVLTLEAAPGGSGGSKLKGSADIPVGFAAGLSPDAEFANLGTPQADKNVGAPRTKSLQTPPPGADITAFRMTATKGHLPSVYDYETFAQASVTNLHCEMPMAFTSSNRAYVLVFAPYLAAGSISARIRAEYSDFHLSNVSPAEAGNAGSITVQIRGTGFTTNTLAELARNGANPVVGQAPLVIDSTEMFVTFDLRGLGVGSYDLRLEDTGFPAVVLSNAFLIKTGIGPRLETRLSAPASVRAGRKYVLQIEYENTGDADLPAPAMQLTNSARALMQIGQSGRATTGRLSLLGVSQDGLAGVLVPHRPQSIPVTFVAPNAGRTVFHLSVNPGTQQAVDWNAIGAELRPFGATDEEWNAYFGPAAGQLGSQWADLIQSLSLLTREKAPSQEIAADLFGTIVYSVGLSAESALSSTTRRPGDFDPGRDVQLVWDRQQAGSGCCLYVVTHGWNSSANDAHIGGLAGNIARHCQDCRVVRVNWQRGAKSGLPWGASGNIQAAADEAYRKLQQALGAGFDWNCATFVGHSFGNSINKGISAHTGSNGHGKGRGVILDPPNAGGGSDIDFAGFYEGGSAAVSTDSLADNGPCWPNARRIADRHYHLHSGLGGEGHGAALRCLEDQLANGSGCDNPWLNGMPGGSLTTPGSFSGNVGCDGAVTNTPYAACDDNDIDVPGEDGGSATNDVVRPIDPNDKLGPAGVGPNRVVSAQDEMEYMIRFENFATASAPVQELIVVDYLDAGLDWTTARFKEMAYGGRIITPAAGSQSFAIRDTPPADSPALTGIAAAQMVVNASGSINSQMGRVEWRLSAMDTNTSFFPLDALTGFLPPEDGTGRGQGYVKLAVRPRNHLPIGTAITNIATIVFDGNDPIATPAVWNILGDVPSLAVTIAYLPGQIMAGTPFTYTVGLTNSGTNAVTNVVVTNALPSGFGVVSNYVTMGTVSATNGILTWSVGTLTNGADARWFITVLPTVAGTFTNNITFSGGSGLAIYTTPGFITVLPAAPALGIRLVNGQVELFWSTNFSGFRAQKTSALSNSNQWTDLANLPVIVGQEYRVTIGPPVGAQYYRLSNASVSSGPPPSLGIQVAGSQVQLSWPTNANGFRLQSAQSIGPSPVWGDVTNPPAASGGFYRITVSPTPSSRYFRLIK